MENNNQEIPQVPAQPPVKVANNLSFAKALAYGFVIVSIGISIAVGGYLLGASKTKNQPIVKTLTPTPLPTEAAAKAGDPTANWKTYVNSKVGFQIKYPSTYSKPLIPSGVLTAYADGNTDNNAIIFSTNERPPSFQLIVFTYENKLVDLVKDRKSNKFVQATQIPIVLSGLPTRLIQSLIVDNTTAEWHDITYENGSESGTNEIYLIGNNHGFIFQFNTSEYTTEQIKEILSTFKFTQ